MQQSTASRPLALVGVTLVLATLIGSSALAQQPRPTQTKDCQASSGAGNPLPLPSTCTLEAFEKQVMQFLRQRTYKTLGWKRDKGIRNAGPYVQGRSYGNHWPVTIYYSPEMIAWLEGDRKGPIKPNAMIIKEMYEPPAVRYYKDQTITYRTEDLLPEDELEKYLTGWAIMIKDDTVAKDGWFWGTAPVGQQKQEEAIRFDQNPFSKGRWMGFAQACFRCHSSAERDMTFSSLHNIEGYPGDPTTFLYDHSWHPSEAVPAPAESVHMTMLDAMEAATGGKLPTSIHFNPEFVRFFDTIAPIPPHDVVPIPPVGYDTVLSRPDGPEQFLTSDQCQPCHDGFAGATGNNMYIPASNGSRSMNLAPFGEWRWSMMGLAGRDPVFYAQLETERILQPEHAPAIADLCLKCHGVMGQRQYHIDTEDSKLFQEAFVYATDATDPAHAKYGALARDGISCTVCHHIVDDGAKSIVPIQTGNFDVGSPDKIYGPFENIITRPMEQTLGLTPEYDAYVKESRLCGSCHTIYLPVYDAQGNKLKDEYEQTTYLEWLNSDFARQDAAGKTCQACHMPDTYHNQKLAFEMAAIQDQNHPTAEHLAPLKDITVRKRSNFRRHTLLGINVFVLEMFNQFSDILGVNRYDYFPENSDGLPNAIRISNELAKRDTGAAAITEVRQNDQTLAVDVTVANRTGHKFPSGVGFRRAFLTFQVSDVRTNTVLWASGRTNRLGIIVDQNGKPLPSEFFEEVAGKQAYQPHHQTIRSQGQVQIYEELAQDPQQRFTTSFVARNTIVKDNRLLPKGWRVHGPSARYTTPHGRACQDQDYPCVEGAESATGVASGADVITYEVPLESLGDTPPHQLRFEVALYYQSIPPYYLRQRFTAQKHGRQAKDGPNTRRLYYLASNLEVDGTPVQAWKLAVASDCKQAALSRPGQTQRPTACERTQ
jgi:hypothetical protein